MAGVRVLVGTRKGAFVLTSDAGRREWQVAGPHFGGWVVYHLKGSPADPDRIWASQSSGWFGQLVQRSDDGGRSWAPVGKDFVYDGVPGTHQSYDGTAHPWEFARVWHLEPSPTDPETEYAGVEDAALFRSTDGGGTWSELSGLRTHGSGPRWQPGAGGLCLHTVLLHPTDPQRIVTAISAAGAFRSDDGGESWLAINQGLRSEGIPDPDAEVGHCVHKLALHPDRPDTLFMQKHWDVMRSDDAGGSWTEISGDLPSDFGFVIDVHAHEPDTVYVVPPSVVRKAPAAEIATYSRSASVGCCRTVCRHMPPAPGCHCGPVSCLRRPDSSVHDPPPSVDLKSAASSTPA